VRGGLEKFCPNLTLTFNSPDKRLGGVTYGGYSDSIVVDQRFVLRIPSHLDPAGTSPRARKWAWSASAAWATGE
jgi:alcohol dehydrogenase (NADP+)